MRHCVLISVLRSSFSNGRPFRDVVFIIIFLHFLSREFLKDGLIYYFAISRGDKEYYYLGEFFFLKNCLPFVRFLSRLKETCSLENSKNDFNLNIHTLWDVKPVETGSTLKIHFYVFYLFNMKYKYKS